MKKFRKVFKIIWFSLVTIFIIWNWTTFQSRNLPDDTFQSTNEISAVEDDDKISFQNRKGKQDIEVIFFQGGLTDPKAYAPFCRQMAANGFTCHLIKMAWRMPQYDYKKISGLFNFQSGNYVLGGHSQGGKMAAQFANEHPGLLKGLFLLGTSHPRGIDLSNQSIPCLKIYAEHDGLASMGEVLANKSLLPANTTLLLLKGGNHSQFGYLGKLFMDDKATISLYDQQIFTTEQLIIFLNGISNL